jgi:pimeloyl-ACP methyl ester carboxylesterase
LVPEPFLHQGKLFRDEFKTRGVPDSLSVLLINGEFDSITPPQVFDQNPLLNRLETKRVIISNAGHFPWIENQRAVENALTGELQNC